MFKPLLGLPRNTACDFVRQRFIAFACSLLLFIVAIGSIAAQGLNLGIDFRGGILIEAEHKSGAVDVSALRGALAQLGLGQTEIQNFGGPATVLIRVQQQDGGDAAQMAAIEKVRAQLGDAYNYRRVEVVGPRVGNELFTAGIWATLLALLGIAIYVALRFEWQFGVAALAATFHDVFVTAGLYSVLQLDFDLTAVAALLLLAGYSINDTVVVFDRIRENLRRTKSPDLKKVINDAVNQTLSRTLATSGTTFIVLIPLAILGGAQLANFTVAILFGIFIGTFSSIYVAASLLLYLPPLRRIEAPKPVAAT